MLDQISLTGHHCLAITPFQSQHLGDSSNFFIIIKEHIYKIGTTHLQQSKMNSSLENSTNMYNLSVSLDP